MTYNEEVAKAIRVIAKAMLEDPGYRMAWQASIAVSFQDRFPQEYKAALSAVDLDIHELSNKAADNFLKTLTFATEVEIANECKSN